MERTVLTVDSPGGQRFRRPMHNRCAANLRLLVPPLTMYEEHGKS